MGEVGEEEGENTVAVSADDVNVGARRVSIGEHGYGCFVAVIVRC